MTQITMAGPISIPSTLIQMSINLGLVHLRGIVALAEHGSFTAASEALNIPQSSLSRSIAEAERRLNVRLFFRTTRRVVTTPDGLAICQLARHALNAYDDGLRTIEDFLTGEQGTVSVACLPSVAATFLPSVIKNFTRSYPGVMIQVNDGLLASCLRAIDSQDADLAIAPLPAPIDGVEHEFIGADSYYCVAPAGHRFTETAHLLWSDLADEPFIGFGAASSIAAPVQRAFNEAGIKPKLIVQAQNIAAVAALTAEGMGVTVVPGMVLSMMDFPGAHHIPLLPRVERKLYLIQRSGRLQTAPVRAFIEAVRAGGMSGAPHRPR